MTQLHFGYKDVFRALRLGFSAKKVWMLCLGVTVGTAGYSILTYLAYLVSGSDFLTVWENFRLLPFPEPWIFPFPWYSWVIYGLGALFGVVACLVTGTAVSKVAYEQLRGDEFYESREAFKFAFRNIAAVLASPLLLAAFIAVVVACGLLLSLIGAIPYFGEMFVGLMGLPAFAAAMFIVYLLVVLLFTLLIGPSVVGATRSDTFDTLFEVFSCVNEQPGRLLWYQSTLAVLAGFGSFLLAAASTAAGRIGFIVLRAFMGTKMPDVMANAAFYFKVNLPEWCPGLLRALLFREARLLGLPHIYMPSEYTAIGWSVDVAALLVGVAIYIVALMVLAYGLSVWYTGNTLVYAILARKKDEKNILELPEDEEELIEPVVPPPEPPTVPLVEEKPAKEAPAAEPKEPVPPSA